MREKNNETAEKRNEQLHLTAHFLLANGEG